MANKLVLSLSGLHCRACEVLTEDKFQELPGVTKARVSYKSGRAEIFYDGAAPDRQVIAKELEAMGYGLNQDGTSVSSGRKAKVSDYWLSVILGLALLYWLISRLNFFDAGAFLQGSFSLPLALLIGLVAGVSTCLALVGGLVLAAAASYAQNHPEATRAQKFRPHLLFNAGRVIGFFVLGGVLGLIGSAFKISPLLNGVLTMAVGVLILILGLKLLGLFPALSNFDLALPKSWGRKMKADQPLILGALTFFLPCGFTQAMQLYALGSGSFWTGGLIMAFFALGTLPGLLGLGGLASLLNKNKSQVFFKVAGSIVIIFAMINLNNGWELTRVAASGYGNGKEITQNKDNAPLTDDADVQIVRMVESGRGYSPNQFTIIKDKPVRWIIDAQAPYSCASSLIVPALNIRRQLKAGENIIEFTPTKTGNLPFSCSMGMYTGNFTVISK